MIFRKRIIDLKTFIYFLLKSIVKGVFFNETNVANDMTRVSQGKKVVDQ